MNAATLKEHLADAILMLEHAEIIDFNGHFSARLPGTPHVLINSGKSVRSALTAADFVTIDMDGNLVDGDAVPPMEFHIHTEIYRRRPDVQAVVHTHPVWSTLFSMTGMPYLARRLGEPAELSAADIETIRRNLWKPNLLQKVWDYHHAKLRR